eukprot:126148-Rhodomonas_salina.1
MTWSGRLQRRRRRACVASTFARYPDVRTGLFGVRRTRGGESTRPRGASLGSTWYHGTVCQ